MYKTNFRRLQRGEFKKELWLQASAPEEQPAGELPAISFSLKHP